jgi:hypothetical protein
LNRKIVRRIIEGSPDNLPCRLIREADDGVSALDELRTLMVEGETVDFVLMDYVMVIT